MKRGRAHVSRRLFVRGSGGAIVALPFLPSWPGLGAQASEPPLRRFVALFSPYGHAPSQFVRSTGAIDAGKTPALQPLQKDHADALVIVHGLCMKSSETKGPIGIGSALTGTKPGKGRSLDQEIVRALGLTSLESLSLGVGVPGSPAERVNLSFASADHPIWPMCDPTATFDSLTSSDASRRQTPLAARKRSSVLDGVKKNFAATLAKLGGDDKTRVDEHFTQLRELETRLSAVTAIPQPVCPLGDRPTTTNVFSDERADVVADLQVDMIAMALRCDLKRVASLMLAEAGSTRLFPFLGWTGTSPADTWAGLAQAAARKEAAALNKMQAVSQWSARKVARLVEALKAAQDGTGTVFDGTTILWVTDCSIDSSHDNVPFVVAAGRNSGLRRGQSIIADQRPHNDLLLTILQTYAPARTTFGTSSVCTGPISALQA